MPILVSVIVCIHICIGVVASSRSQPNIVFILADDLGWNDVSWNNNKMLTPTLEHLARKGVRLDQAYSQQVCTPSRAALLTGKYPFHIGRQKRALKPLQPTGLHLNLTTLPQELKKLGYNTHIVGK
jgi:arylsulfatase A-like enzyme